MADKRITPAVNHEKSALRDIAVRAQADLDNIINTAGSGQIGQLRQSIATLARNQKQIIRRLVQIENG